MKKTDLIVTIYDNGIQATRLISGDYTSGDQGCVSRLLTELQLQSLQDRRKISRVVYFFKVVEGLVPAMQSYDFLTSVREK